MKQDITRNIDKLYTKIVQCVLIFVLLVITIILSMGIPSLIRTFSSF
jgi:hypothetical protein